MALGETAAGRPPAEDDDPDHDDIVDHVPQAVDTKKLMGEGWQFEAPTTGELEEPQSADSKKKYFEGLTKLNEDGHSLAEYCNGLGLDDDDHAGQQPFAVLRARMEDLLGDGGIMKLVEAPGSGAQVTPGSVVSLHYVGQFEGFDEPHDSTYVRNHGKPERHLVGPNSKLLPGLNQTILSMKKGETCLALVAPQYGYGKMGCGPRIPGDSEVLFRVTVLSFFDKTDADEFGLMTEEEQKSSTFEQRIKAMRAHHLAGNELYKETKYHQAAKSYREGIQVFLVNMSFKNEEQHQEAKHLVFKLMNNRMQCLNKTYKWVEAAKQGRQALHYEDCADEDMRVMCYVRLGLALSMLLEFTESASWLNKARRLRPRSRDVATVTERLAQRQRDHKLEEIEFARRVFQPKNATSEAPDDTSTAAAATKERQAEPEMPTEGPEAAAIYVTDDFKRNVEDTLRKFLADPGRRELPLPLHQTEDGHHKLAHICVRCKELGLLFKCDEGMVRARVVKPDK